MNTAKSALATSLLGAPIQTSLAATPLIPEGRGTGSHQ